MTTLLLWILVIIVGPPFLCRMCADRELEPMPWWMHALYVGVIGYLLCAPGYADLREAERLSVEGFVNDSATITSVADGHLYVFAATTGNGVCQ